MESKPESARCKSARRIVARSASGILVVAVIAWVGCVVMASRECRTLEREKRATNQLRKLGAEVLYSEPRGTKWHWALGRRERSTQGVVTLNLSGDRIRDKDLSLLADLPQLKSLEIRGSAISEAALSTLTRVSSLEQLILIETDFGDAAIEHIARLERLDDLHLAYTKITDASLRRLAQMPNLQVLNLNSTDITDEGFQELYRSRSLRVIDIRGTSVSAAEAQAFFEANPEITLKRD